MRADAQRNRERIVAAAREMFVEQGPDVALDEVARRAGVGNATLYRHFADRQELLRQVTLLVMARVADRAEAARDESDPFEALRRFVHAAAEERVGALSPLISDGIDRDGPELFEERTRLERAVEALMAAGRRRGLLRDDVAVGDLMVAVAQLTRPLPGSDCTDFDGFVHRHLHLFLDGLRPSAQSELPGEPATLEALRRPS
ncbi:TetR/AcrR family transcriptional regulator [Streptomyces meridianus]|uniref:TetR/AcrR family transcriptional regulator n=1 Tax=Streptomyces meridianus TaxID=2938945 RepID=A0ABT0X939_9ACTN|nr:TetR/AcrR family transcriptional regulator [Streptomyces meridianus]MCM2579054.1 TetR/AcrR family transcriptional regulator [Streptomyces meridianus]